MPIALSALRHQMHQGLSEICNYDVVTDTFTVPDQNRMVRLTRHQVEEAAHQRIPLVEFARRIRDEEMGIYNHANKEYMRQARQQQGLAAQREAQYHQAYAQGINANALGDQRLNGFEYNALYQRAQKQRAAITSADYVDPIVAIKRSLQLLVDALNLEQLKEFAVDHVFTVIGSKSKKPYKISKGFASNVTTDEASYCAPADRSKHDVPVYDSMLAQKIILELDEDRFLKVAVRRPRYR